MPLEGLQLGKYRLLRLIGSGGMGDVYIGEDPSIGRQVAIKVMRTEMSSYPNEKALKQGERLFQREMRAIAILDHPYILPLYDYGEEALHKTTLMYMVMPFRQEGSFADWLQQRDSTNLLSLSEISYFLSQAADALQHAHDHQIIHQDVKPSNFLVRSKRTLSSLPDLLLADFGIARINSLTSSMSHSSRGTPTYMAPEQWRGDPVPATDQYALAIMIYELLIGHPPFHGSPEQMMFMHLTSSPASPSLFNTKLAVSIDAVILRALMKDPTKRFSTISDFATSFQQAMLRQGDLHATLAISSTEASTGATREFTLPGGRKAQVVIPQDVREGHLISLEGLGEPYYDQGPIGRLILTITIPSLEETVIAKNAAYDETLTASSVSTSHVPNSSEKRLDDVPPIEEGKLLSEGSNKNVLSKTKEQWLDEGNNLYSRRLYEQALAAYKQGLQIAPNDPMLRDKYDRTCAYLNIPFAKRFPSVSPLESTPSPSAISPVSRKHTVAQNSREQWLNGGEKPSSTKSYENANSRKTMQITGLAAVIFLLFLVINVLTNWNIAIVSVTVFFGLVVLFILGQDIRYT